MAQIDNLFTAIWYDVSAPLTGLSATITIRDKSTNTIVVNNEAMTEIGLGEYDYTFEDMDVTKAYSYVMNPNVPLAFVETGFVDPRIAYIDKSVSEIAVGWNPYIEGFTNLKKGIQKIVDKVEEKGEEVKTKVETEVKSIIIPEQKEPIVNVTTEKIDTSGFIAEIQKIKPEVTVNTEKVEVDMTPILTAIKEIPLPVIPEPKEVDISPIVQSISEIKDIIGEQSEKIDTIEDYVEEEKRKEKEEEVEKETEMKEIEEEENLKKPFPSEFTATLK